MPPNWTSILSEPSCSTAFVNRSVTWPCWVSSYCFSVDPRDLAENHSAATAVRAVAIAATFGQPPQLKSLCSDRLTDATPRFHRLEGGAGCLRRRRCWLATLRNRAESRGPGSRE